LADRETDGQVTTEKPAMPNGVIRFYGVGFGPVDTAVADGLPTPSEPVTYCQSDAVWRVQFFWPSR
jgi:uncharacterized protein (TIGR03437 family)